MSGDILQDDSSSEEGGFRNPALNIEEPPGSDTELDIRIMRRKRAQSVFVGDLGAAVVVRDADKSYKAGTPVLMGLNMTVPCGSIYGLLGSSGCGKTTLLSCIIANRKLDSGNIWVFGSKPGTDKSIGVPGKNIGYMPQDISLYMEFSIEETLTYFGTLCGMSSEQVKTTRAFLKELLDLPKESRRISSLSGGQQRRVSFATALIHEPELLILDEPTVGVDPVLRQNIWKHLGKLVSSKRTTVIITTHYIEEARNADNIGIMRSGRLLAEKNPQELMDDYGSTLEKVVLRLCRKDTALKINPSDFAEVLKRRDAAAQNEDGKKIPDVRMAGVMKEPETGVQDSLIRIKALTGKNFAILFRNLILLSFVIWIPVFLVSIMCLALGSDPTHLSIGLVNDEVDHYSVCTNITRVIGECNIENLSCQFLRNIPEDTVDLKIFNTEEDALTAVQEGKTWGFIKFPNEFSSLFWERAATGANVDEATLNGSEIIVRLDESSKQTAAPIKKALYDAFEDFIADMLSDCGFDERQGESVLKFNTPIFGRDNTDFREYLAPSLAVGIIFFFPIITSAIRYIQEKKCGMMERSLVAGVNVWEIMVAYSISEFFVLAIQALLTYAVLTLVFKIHVLGTGILIVITYLLSGYGGVSMGFLFGSFCTEEIQAAILAMAAFFPNFLLSGLVWPVEGMPVPLQYVAYVLPCTLSSESVRSIVSRGWEFSHPNVWPGFVILIAYIVGYFILTVLIHKVFKR
ncbi:unnamed protein product [Orchesella dallaii]|uniref:ABC transporter G family member 23 n=1 Tax=Orchesella dallaii TaxID=48710 RepID=A0ABP1PR94_9HEXA